MVTDWPKHETQFCIKNIRYNQQTVVIYSEAIKSIQILILNTGAHVNGCVEMLTLYTPSRLQQTTVLNIFSLFFFFFSEKIRLDSSFESSSSQRFHVKYQALFSSKVKSKK